MQKYHIPYGVYSYSTYSSNSEAQTEAKLLYQNAKSARFYVNDCEENDVNNGSISQATLAWANQIKQLTKKPIVLYSGLDFMTRNLQPATSAYNALWIAAYGQGEPNPSYHYDLWQYTDSYYSKALNQKVDASIIPAGGKSLSFWTGGTTSKKNNSKQPPKKIKVKKVIYHHFAKTKVKYWHGYNLNYYSDNRIKQLKIKNPKGITIYNSHHQPIMQCNYGDVIQVKFFKKVGHIQQAVTPNGNYFTANKKLVQQVKMQK